MQKYIFCTNGDKTRTIPKEVLNRHYTEIYTENKRQVIEKMHKCKGYNLNYLANFSGDILFYVFLYIRYSLTGNDPEEIAGIELADSVYHC